MFAGNMRPVFAKGNQRTVRLLLQLRKEAIKDQEPRVAQRFHAMALSIEGQTTSEIAQSLKVHRSCIPLWIENWNRHREQGLLEGHRAGRPVGLKPRSGSNCRIFWTAARWLMVWKPAFGLPPSSAGLSPTSSTSTTIPGHVRKLLKQLGYSVQRPTTRLVQADPDRKNRWVRYTYPRLKKKPGAKGR